MCIGSPLRARVLNYFWTKSPFSISVAFSDVTLLELQCNLTCHPLFQLFLSCLFLISVAVMSNGNKQTFRIHPVQNQFSITKPFGFEVGGWASFLTAKVQSLLGGMDGPDGSADDPGGFEEASPIREAYGSVDPYRDQILGLRRASVSHVTESEVGSCTNVEDALQPFVNFGEGSNGFDYSPSVASSLNPGSFSAGVSVNSERVDLEQFDPQREFEQAWHRIGGQDTKQLWESGFWEDFFNPSSNPVDSLLRVDLKRIAQPLENPSISEETSVVTLEPPVKKRVVETYMQAVKLRKQSNVMEGYSYFTLGGFH